MARRYNELKIMILDHLKSSEAPMLSKEIAANLGLCLKDTQMCCLRLKRRGLVDRRKVSRFGQRGRPAFSYSISDRGRTRLQYASVFAYVLRVDKETLKYHIRAIQEGKKRLLFTYIEKASPLPKERARVKSPQSL